jgi:hypothetical protein
MAIDRSSLRKIRQDLRKKRYDLRSRYTEVPKMARKTRPRRRRAPPPEDISDKKIADDSREAALYAYISGVSDLASWLTISNAGTVAINKNPLSCGYLPKSARSSTNTSSAAIQLKCIRRAQTNYRVVL